MNAADHVVFTSARFAVEPGEDDETNPGIYGKSLAEWVAEKLRARGLPVERIVAEDFGRCVMVRRRPFMLWVACANIDQSRTHWQMFVALERWPFAWIFRGRQAQTEFDRLRKHFRAIVQEVPDVADIEWQ